MRRDKIVLDRETWYELCEFHHRLSDNYYNEKGENKKLREELGYLKALFDKEGDTQAIKYNGKLYRIVSTNHFHNVGEVDTIDINAVCVDEVNRDGKMQV